MPIFWTHAIDFLISQFTTDSTQDLMVVVERNRKRQAFMFAPTRSLVIYKPGRSNFAFTAHVRTMTTDGLFASLFPVDQPVSSGVLLRMGYIYDMLFLSSVAFLVICCSGLRRPMYIDLYDFDDPGGYIPLTQLRPQYSYSRLFLVRTLLRRLYLCNEHSGRDWQRDVYSYSNFSRFRSLCLFISK